MQATTYAIIGMGNVGRTLATRLLAVGIPAEGILICDSNSTRAESAAKEFNTRPVTLTDAPVCQADVLLLATPPKNTPAILRQLATMLTPRQVVVSFAAAIPLAQLEALLPAGVAVVRVMPNAPSLVGKGMNPVVYGTAVTSEVKALTEPILAALGKTLEVQDEQMNWCVGLSGAAMRSLLPALEGMTQAGVEAGFVENDARLLAAQVMFGSAALVLETRLSFDEIKSLTPMQTVDEQAVAKLYRDAARAAKEKIDQLQSKIAAD